MTDVTRTDVTRTDRGPTSIRIRRARVEDAAALSQFAERTFRETFSAQNTPDDMAAYVAGAFSPERQAAEIADPAAIVLVATAAAGESNLLSPPTVLSSPTLLSPMVPSPLIGYAHLTEGAPPPQVQGPAPIELKRFYVASSWQGRGLAQALMQETLNAAALHGARTLWLGVWEHNPRAIAFYHKAGFAIVGTHDFRLGTDRQTDKLMARPLPLSS